jgi:hypothetical protein
MPHLLDGKCFSDILSVNNEFNKIHSIKLNSILGENKSQAL